MGISTTSQVGDAQAAPETLVAAPRTRRQLLTAAVAAAGGALATRAFVVSESAEAANGDAVRVGQSKTGTAVTQLTNAAASSAAVAIKGVVSTTVGGGGTAGVWGQSAAQNGNGVFGYATNTGSDTKGVRGRSANGKGVYGEATGTSGTNYGVYGISASASSGGTGVYGEGPTAVRANGTGNGYGVNANGGYSGLYGSGGSYGLIAYGNNSGAYGVYAAGSTGLYASGSTYGVQAYGTTGVYGSGSTGVYGTGGPIGVRGYTAAGGDTAGVQGEAPYRGVKGYGGNAGVYGNSGYVGAWAEGGTYGVYGVATATSGQNYGIFGTTNSAAGFAGYFQGNVAVAGTLSKSAGSFRIDHPLAPDRKWLQHSFVESSDMMNIYNGNVTTNARGLATVRLPRWFGALNRDFRYQLTVMGKMAQAVIDQQVEGNRFRIRTSEPGVEVSWQVTGIRQDDYANAHRIKVELSKSKKDVGTRSFVARGSGAKRMNVGPGKSKRPRNVRRPEPKKVHPRRLPRNAA